MDDADLVKTAVEAESMVDGAQLTITPVETTLDDHVDDDVSGYHRLGDVGDKGGRDGWGWGWGDYKKKKKWKFWKKKKGWGWKKKKKKGWGHKDHHHHHHHHQHAWGWMGGQHHGGWGGWGHHGGHGHMGHGGHGHGHGHGGWGHHHGHGHKGESYQVHYEGAYKEPDTHGEYGDGYFEITTGQHYGDTTLEIGEKGGHGHGAGGHSVLASTPKQNLADLSMVAIGLAFTAYLLYKIIWKKPGHGHLHHLLEKGKKGHIYHHDHKPEKRGDKEPVIVNKINIALPAGKEETNNSTYTTTKRPKSRKNNPTTGSKSGKKNREPKSKPDDQSVLDNLSANELQDVLSYISEYTQGILNKTDSSLNSIFSYFQPASTRRPPSILNTRSPLYTTRRPRFRANNTFMDHYYTMRPEVTLPLIRNTPSTFGWESLPWVRPTTSFSHDYYSQYYPTISTPTPSTIPFFDTFSYAESSPQNTTTDAATLVYDLVF